MKRMMSFMIRGFVFLLLCVFFCSVDTTELHAEGENILSVGAAKVNITPKVPIPMSGYGGRKGPFKGIHDDLFIRVILFSDGENKAAIIAADLIVIKTSYWEKVTERLNKEIGIPRENIILCATHTHGGPSPAYRYNFPSAEIIAYTDEMTEKLISVVKEAVLNLTPAKIGAGIGECKLNINRRARRPDGTMTIGRNFDGPVDHEVAVVRIDDMSDNPIAIFINWPCHGTITTGNNYLITSEWPGATAKFVEKEFGNKIIVQVTAGASGDINPLYRAGMENIDAFGPRGEVEITGIILGKEVHRVAERIKTSAKGGISALQRVISVPGKRELTPIRNNEQITTDLPKGDISSPEIEIRLSVLKIGQIIFTGVSGEVMNEIGVKTKGLSPYKYTFMITNCNGSSGYLVTDEAYEEGGYEVRSTRVKSGAEKAIIENLLDMIYGF